MRDIIINGLPVPMEHGIPMYGKPIKVANSKNPFWNNYSIGYYISGRKKVYVRFNSNNQFVVIK